MKDLSEAVAELKRNPDGRVLARVEGLVLALRVERRLTADDLFEEVGRWEGETADEMARLLRDARNQGSAKEPPVL